MPLDYKGYWDTRYQGQGGAGGGTYGDQARWTRGEIAKVVSDLRVETCTDIGCGECDLYDGKLPVPEESYLGIDISPNAISKAREKYPKASFIVGNAIQMIDDGKTVDGWNDLMICTDVMFHLTPLDLRKLLVWMYQNASKAIVVKTIFGCGTSESDYHWDHGGFLAPPPHWKVANMQKHPYNKLAQLWVLERNG
jgi:hypothetical protein